MDWEKIKYSKCPNCEQQGIPAFSKIAGKYTRRVECKHCGKKYKVNIMLNCFKNIGIALLTSGVAILFEKYIFELPMSFWVLMMLIELAIFEYFAPLEKLGED